MYPNTNHFTNNSLLVIINFTETIHSKSILVTVEPNIYTKQYGFFSSTSKPCWLKNKYLSFVPQQCM